MNRLGLELEAGCWEDASRLNFGKFAGWYSAYLTVIREIGTCNCETVAALLELDHCPDDLTWPRCPRGFLRLFEKLLWWSEMNVRRGEPVKIFR